MDLTPPSLTTSPASSQVGRFDSPTLSGALIGPPVDSSAASYPSPDLLDYSFKAVSPYLNSNTLPIPQSIWNSPESMASNSNVSLAPSMHSVLQTSDFDNFSNYDPNLTAPFSLAESYPALPALSSAGNILRTTPPVSRPASAATSSSIMEPPSTFGYVHSDLVSPSKLNALPAFAQSLDPPQFSSTVDPSITFTSDEAAFPDSAQHPFSGGGFSQWPREAFQQQPLGSSPGLPASAPSSLETQDRERSIKSRKERSQRRRTTKEEANFECTVKGCGKFFSRSYNFKSHLETHDEKREYPFPCPLEGCSKKFVRKTDLARHHQSVHMKERNHKCGFCGRLFARKDTLRRHMEDGCSKRFDLETMDVRAEANGVGSGKRHYSGKTSNSAKGKATSCQSA